MLVHLAVVHEDTVQPVIVDGATASFAEYLQRISVAIGGQHQHHSNLDISSFEYEDDEGDRILVTSDSDVHGMVTLYSHVVATHGPSVTVTVYPCLSVQTTTSSTAISASAADTAAAARNFLGLTVDVAASGEEREGVGGGGGGMRGGERSSLDLHHQQESMVVVANAVATELDVAGSSSSISISGGGYDGDKAGGSLLGAATITPPALSSPAIDRLEDVLRAAPLDIRAADLRSHGPLGHGAVGSVHLVEHVPTGTMMAVKRLSLVVGHTVEEVQLQISRELSILYQCDSPYIIGFYGAVVGESVLEIFTEYMDGGSLDRYGIIPETVLAPIAHAVLQVSFFFFLVFFGYLSHIHTVILFLPL